MAYINEALIRVMLGVSSLKARLSEERGQDLLEYALLGGFIAAALVAGFLLFDDAVTSMTTGIAGCIDFVDGGCNPGP